MRTKENAEANKRENENWIHSVVLCFHSKVNLIDEITNELHIKQLWVYFCGFWSGLDFTSISFMRIINFMWLLLKVSHFQVKLMFNFLVVGTHSCSGKKLKVLKMGRNAGKCITAWASIMSSNCVKNSLKWPNNKLGIFSENFLKMLLTCNLDPRCYRNRKVINLSRVIFPLVSGSGIHFMFTSDINVQYQCHQPKWLLPLLNIIISN